MRRRDPCFESQEEDEEEVDYVKSKMRSGLSQTLEHVRKSTIGRFLVRYRRLFVEVLHERESFILSWAKHDKRA